MRENETTSGYDEAGPALAPSEQQTADARHVTHGGRDAPAPLLSISPMRLSVIFTSIGCVASTLAGAQAAPPEARAIDSIARVARELGRAYGASVWPGFRPDTIPVAFVLPSRGMLLAGWRGPLPQGFTPAAGTEGLAWRPEAALGAASTSISLGGRSAAQVVVPRDSSAGAGAGRTRVDGAELTALAFHEAFHTFQGAARQEGRRFGQGENAFYVASYPVFDVDNEALFALEGTLLAAALEAHDARTRLARAREFVGVRRRRHARLTTEIAAFDDASELNEGLAQYAQLRALQSIGREGPTAWRASAERELARERAQLAGLTGDATRSFRLRYYSTGPAMALLLDAIAGEGWKQRLVDENATLERALAAATGIDSVAEEAARRAIASANERTLRDAAAARVASLRERRLRQVDSVLAAPGLRVVVALDSLGRDFGMCGFDPQNHLRVTPTLELQTRWWRPCAGAAASAELGVPSVHDRERRTVTAVLGAEAEVTLTADGKPLVVGDGETVRGVKLLKLTAPRGSVEAARADVSRVGRTVTVRVLP
jgi:hypothetical protein